MNLISRWIRDGEKQGELYISLSRSLSLSHTICHAFSHTLAHSLSQVQGERRDWLGERGATPHFAIALHPTPYTLQPTLNTLQEAARIKGGAKEKQVRAKKKKSI